jgi:hypothetical protein
MDEIVADLIIHVTVRGYPEPVPISVVGREAFCNQRFDYSPGEHVLFGGPTQNGKTTLAFELLKPIVSPELPVYVSVTKPVDPTSTKYGRQLNLRRVNQWPPPRKLSTIGDKPNGFLIWPRFGDMNVDVENAAEVNRQLLGERYAAAATHGAKGKYFAGILMMDDTVNKSQILRLDPEMTNVITMAGAMNLGMWTFVQKPTNAGKTALWAYGNSEHIFLFRDPDRRNQLRYDEIGGFEPALVAAVANELHPFQALYLRRTGRQMCIVDKK